MTGRMFKVLATAASGFGLMVAASAANATCTKPVGVFVGAGAGAILQTTSGAPYNAAAISLSLKIKSDGSMKATEQGKTVLGGLYSYTWTVGASKNSFDTTTCQGTIITSRYDRFTYTSSGSGNVITLIYTRVSNIVGVYTIRLEKV